MVAAVWRLVNTLAAPYNSVKEEEEEEEGKVEELYETACEDFSYAEADISNETPLVAPKPVRSPMADAHVRNRTPTLINSGDDYLAGINDVDTSVLTSMVLERKIRFSHQEQHWPLLCRRRTLRWLRAGQMEKVVANLVTMACGREAALIFCRSWRMRIP